MTLSCYDFVIFASSSGCEFIDFHQPGGFS